MCWYLHRIDYPQRVSTRHKELGMQKNPVNILFQSCKNSRVMTPLSLTLNLIPWLSSYWMQSIWNGGSLLSTPKKNLDRIFYSLRSRAETSPSHMVSLSLVSIFLYIYNATLLKLRHCGTLLSQAIRQKLYQPDIHSLFGVGYYGDFYYALSTFAYLVIRRQKCFPQRVIH